MTEDEAVAEDVAHVEVKEPVPVPSSGSLPAKQYDPHPREDKGPPRVEDQVPEE